LKGLKWLSEKKYIAPSKRDAPPKAGRGGRLKRGCFQLPPTSVGGKKQMKL